MYYFFSQKVSSKRVISVHKLKFKNEYGNIEIGSIKICLSPYTNRQSKIFVEQPKKNYPSKMMGMYNKIFIVSVPSFR